MPRVRWCYAFEITTESFQSKKKPFSIVIYLKATSNLSEKKPRKKWKCYLRLLNAYFLTFSVEIWFLISFIFKLPGRSGTPVARPCLLLAPFLLTFNNSIPLSFKSLHSGNQFPLKSCSKLFLLMCTLADLHLTSCQTALILRKPIDILEVKSCETDGGSI